MRTPRLTPLRIIGLLILCSACQFSIPTAYQRAYVEAMLQKMYIVQYGVIRIECEITNPEVTSVKLYDDRRVGLSAETKPKNGQFTLTAERLPLSEVYFLEIEGKSDREGAKGLMWKERIPVYAERDSAIVRLALQPVDHPGSISKAQYYVLDASNEQQLLNDWQAALNEQWADRDGRIVEEVSDDEITQQFIQKKNPLVTTLFLTYMTNTHRQHANDYRALYQSMPAYARRTKYGVDLSERLANIMHPSKHLNPSKQLVVVDAGLKRLEWKNFDTCQYILLSFWNSSDKKNLNDIQKLQEHAPMLEKKGITIVHIAMDSRFSQWKKNIDTLNLRHNYKLRNEARQPLIDSLYLTELPRNILIQPDGKVIHAAVFTTDLPGLVRQGLTNQ